MIFIAIKKKVGILVFFVQSEELILFSHTNKQVSAVPNASHWRSSQKYPNVLEISKREAVCINWQTSINKISVYWSRQPFHFLLEVFVVQA